ncbi:MAG: PorT family protein [Chitinophagales bacterium]|nr:PorT family protein [Chitinophagales bacterium]
MKKVKFLFLITLSLVVLTVQAKTKNVQKGRSDAGIRLGASFGVPAGAIPDGASGLPLPAPSIGLFYSYKFTPKWSIEIGAETYSMKARFETPYDDFEYVGDIGKYISINGEPVSDPGETSSIFLKHAFVEDGKFNNRFLVVPVTAQLHFRKGWSFAFGSYVAYNFKKEMTGTARDIVVGSKNYPDFEGLPTEGTMPFNESDKIKDWDFGLNIGGNYEMKSGINFDLRVNAGMIDFFVKEFTAPPSAYRNIVLQTTIGYRLGGSRRI